MNALVNESTDIAALLQQNPLFVFALDYEAAEEFSEYNPYIVGIGKVNAAYHLTKRIIQNKPGIIINLGSAGSNRFSRGEVVCCTRFIQRDMDVTPLGFQQYETPYSNLEPVLQYGLSFKGLQEGTCGTGDNFETAHLSTAYDVIDMEAYPLAWIAMKEQIPFLCLKYISDGADGGAAEEWTEQVHKAAAALKQVITQLV
ncbi:adenosylhomocysteine nucleosidase [Filimonas lacunae]|uniref:Adenosylhomocysteine nucleosidase n=1 Tax=Filimonas lacunae TaxID=477680 RepID=A0A173MGE0_9BACT|nr:nucleosidase [Filimonas lacunae]BAV06488.1 5'-methylthioadenosine nucleosidase [Filimonas lacunae]SIT27136.1 adenosylhomocysteine nucleosidase [Filimonas lacunae]